MQTIEFDSGVRAFRLGDAGVLRFNPADPNLYARFLEAADKIAAVETDLTARAAADNTLPLLQEADEQVKLILNWVFGGDNDFRQILGGVNLFAADSAGHRVVTNLFAALEPILTQGARDFARAKADSLRAGEPL